MLTCSAADPAIADLPSEIKVAVDDGDLRDRLDQSRDAAYFVDRERKIVYWNRAAEQLTGFLRQQILGRFCADGDLLVHCDDGGANLCRAGCPLAATLADGRCRTQRVYLRHAEGHRLPVRVSSAPLLDQSGRLAGAVEVFRAAPPEAPAGPASFGLIWFEIDGWERVLHFYGLDGARMLVRSVAKTLLYCIGRAGTVARWGEAAFLAVVAGGPGFDLEAETGRLLRLLEQTRIPWWGEHPGASLTAGSALLTRYDRDLMAALARARGRRVPGTRRPDRLRLTLAGLPLIPWRSCPRTRCSPSLAGRVSSGSPQRFTAGPMYRRTIGRAPNSGCATSGFSTGGQLPGQPAFGIGPRYCANWGKSSIGSARIACRPCLALLSEAVSERWNQFAPMPRLMHIAMESSHQTP